MSHPQVAEADCFGLTKPITWGWRPMFICCDWISVRTMLLAPYEFPQRSVCEGAHFSSLPGSVVKKWTPGVSAFLLQLESTVGLLLRRPGPGMSKSPQGWGPQAAPRP